MPHIHVTCAIIERNGLVLAARRSALMQLPLKWEFPGGKIRAGEDHLQRFLERYPSLLAGGRVRCSRAPPVATYCPGNVHPVSRRRIRQVVSGPSLS